MFSKVLGVLVTLGGFAVAIYVGLVVMLVGGISEVIDGFNVHPTDGSKIGWGIARIVLATTVTEVIAFCVVAAGVGLLTSGSIRKAWRGFWG